MAIALNICHEPRLWKWSGEGRLLVSTHLDRTDEVVKGSILLREDEGVIIKLAEG